MRERQHEQGKGRERQRERERETERERERIPRRLCTVSTEPDVSLELTNQEIMT